MAKKIINIYLRFSLLLVLAQSFFFATYQIFLVNQGLSLLQINLINLFFMVSNFCLQVPTGAFADICGRRQSVALGCFIASLSFLIYFFSHSFLAFAAAEIVGAIGMTFITGALEAWMIDSLKFHDYTGSLEKIYESEGGWRTIGVIIGSLTGAYVGNYNLALPWLMTSGGMALVGIYAWLKLKEHYRVATPVPKSFNDIKTTAAQGIKYGLRHQSVLYAISFGSILLLCFQGFNMQWPIVFKGYGLSIMQLGLIFNGIAIATYLGNKLSRRCGKIFRHEKNALIFSQVITVGGMLLAASMIGFGPVLGGFFIHEVGRGVFRPLKQAYLNRRLESENRATVLSFDSMINQLGCALGLLLSGYLANTYSISVSWYASALILLVSIIIFGRLKNGN